MSAQAARHISYHDEQAVNKSGIRSIFELLSTAHADTLAKIRCARGRHANRESAAESLVAHLLESLLSEPGYAFLAYAQEYRLAELVCHVPTLPATG